MKNQLESPPRAAGMLRIGALLVLAACGAPPGGDRAEAAVRADTADAPTAVPTDTAGATTVAVQWLFDPAPAERQRLDSVLREIGAAASGPDLRLGGELHRFASSAAPDRYLLVASRDTTPPPAVLGEQEFLFYAIDRAGASAPYRVSGSPESSHPVAVAEVADFDADSVPDLAYCTNGGEEDGGALSIVGYRDGRWYPIAPPAEPGLCR